jgi:hypothetical protein
MSRFVLISALFVYYVSLGPDGIQEVSGSIPLISTKKPDFERNQVFFLRFYP